MTQIGKAHPVVTITIRISQALYEKLYTTSRKIERTMNEGCTEAIEKWLAEKR